MSEHQSASMESNSNERRVIHINIPKPPMNLSRFIVSHIEEILVEWEAFAKTLEPASRDMSGIALRDHGNKILEKIAQEIDTDETSKEKADKSKGLALDTKHTDTAAGEHGTERQLAGFTMLQLISEYRAMRASVLKLWMPKITKTSAEISEQILRFNEAIDKALAESALTFYQQANRTRDTFLAVLGHDLRSPLATMTVAGAYLIRPGVGTDGTFIIGTRVKKSAATMSAIVNDLLQYSQIQLGGKIPISRNLADIGAICRAAVDDAIASNPDCNFELETSGELFNDFDSERLQQVFANLLNYLAQFRGRVNTVNIVAKGDPEVITVQIRNQGQVILPESLKAIFDPWNQRYSETWQENQQSRSLGLGLFISREITESHGGTIDVESSETSGSVFTVRFPKMLPVE